MAEPITKQQLIDASQDAETLEQVVNGNNTSNVTSREGRVYPTIAKALYQVIQTGGFEPFLTQSALLASVPTVPKKAAKALDTKKIWYWNGSSWADTGLSELDQAKNSLTAVTANWLTANSKLFVVNKQQSDIVLKIANAVKKVAVTNPTANVQYSLYRVNKNFEGVGTISISDSSGEISEIVINGVVSGLKWYTLNGIKSARVLINWDEIPDNTHIRPLNLEIDNTVYFTEITNDLSLTDTKTALDSNTSKTTDIIPVWLKTSQKTEFYAATQLIRSSAFAIKSMQLNNADSSKNYRITVVTKADATYGNLFYIHDGTTNVLRYQTSASVVKKGIEKIKLDGINSSGMTGTMTVNWDEISSGISVNSTSSVLVVEQNTSDIFNIDTSANVSAKNIATKNLKFALVGSSITWGAGFLGEQSYVGVFENILRNQYADTIHAADLIKNGTVLTGNNWYKASARRLSGAGSSVEFSLTGNEVSLSIGRERGNAGSCLVDVYVDDVKHSQFSTYNDNALNSRSKNFTGDSSKLKFDLEECFTFDHIVTVGGIAKTGSLNTQGAGASIPSSDDYMVIRNYNATLNKVTHVLWFKVAPTGSIAVTYKQGESIAYMRGTLGNKAQSFTTALESSYGDGSIAESTTEPANVSSGLGFRETDERSIVSFHFDEIKKRKIKLVILSLDRATGLTPFLDLNFVTNRMHRIMNAGIGGWSANLFLTSQVLINRIDEVANFAPDYLLLESCTNDDWQTHLAKATVTRTALTNAQVMSAETSLLYKSITGSANNKTVEDERIYITAVTRNTITLESDVSDSNITAGDAVIIGSYGGNHKRVVVRRVKSYNSSTKTITLDRAISAENFYQCKDLSDLVNNYVLIMNAPTWLQQVKDCVDAVKSAKPLCAVQIATAGIPNYYHRRLFGYREIAQKLCADNNYSFVDFYKATFDYQYTQALSTATTITSTAATEYSFTVSSLRILYNPVVYVDGLEHRNCRIVGGYGYGWNAGQANPTLQNQTLENRAFRLVFDKNVPSSGQQIIVKYSANAWSTDYTHPNNLGMNVFGNVIKPI